VFLKWERSESDVLAEAEQKYCELVDRRYPKFYQRRSTN